MIAIITGDIVNSKQHKSSDWLESLKSALNRYGKQPEDWEIYRGDSFQLKTTVAKSLEACFYIKACIKVYKSLDVRMAVGIGETKGSSGKITEEQGEAFYRSGQCFESLKSSLLAVETGNKQDTATLNLMLELGALTFDRWTSVDAETLKIGLENPEYTQKEIAEKLNKSASTISFTLQKTGYKEILKLLEYYKHLSLNP
ncbi:transcriptional regulator [Psychroflexus sp. YR1-1]|uniref:Transcriptional regulator n=1 Tax=Psychroflexus aurantiacus TaxID=2709310 RepID=A0A6B3R1T7_9FLAO|nr:SatD family protein [Psychroflexus aurantiacus]NEV93420.1 transcriptional regulator [Psychroflexus aurantiacus]